jgi:hypothetical protein
VRGVGDEFWTAFVRRIGRPRQAVTDGVGTGQIQRQQCERPNRTGSDLRRCTGSARRPLCTDPAEAAKFLTAMTMLRGFTAGIPLFASPQAFVG